MAKDRAHYMLLFDQKKNESIKQIIILITKLGKDKSWLDDELARNKSSAHLPIVTQMDLFEMLLICPDYVLTRIVAILKGIEYDHDTHRSASAFTSNSTLVGDLVESLGFILCLKVEGKPYLRDLLIRKGPLCSSLWSDKRRNRVAEAQAEFSLSTDPDGLFIIPQDDPALAEASLRAYLYVGFNPGCTISEISTGTKLGKLAVNAVSELISKNVILEDFVRGWRHYFVPHFSDFLKSLVGTRAKDNHDISDDDRGRNSHHAKEYPPALDSYAELIINCIARQVRLEPIMLSPASGTDPSPDINDGAAGRKHDADTRSENIQSDRIETLPGASDTRSYRLPSLLGQINSRVIEKWLAVSADGKPLAASDNNSSIRTSSLKQEIDWIYAKAGLVAPKRIVVCRSLLEFYEMVLREESLKVPNFKRDRGLLHGAAKSPAGAPSEPAILPQSNDILSKAEKKYLKTDWNNIIPEMVFQTLTDRLSRRPRPAEQLLQQQEQVLNELIEARLRQEPGISSEHENHLRNQMRRQFAFLQQRRADGGNWELQSELQMQQSHGMGSLGVQVEKMRGFYMKQFGRPGTIQDYDFSDGADQQPNVELQEMLNTLRQLPDQWDQRGPDQGRTRAIATLILDKLSRFCQPDNRLACFYLLKKIGVLDASDFDRYFEFLIEGEGVWDIYLKRDVAIVCKPPVRVLLDSGDRLHSVVEAAVQWGDEGNDITTNLHSGDAGDNSQQQKQEGLYFLHGVRFEELLWKKIVKGELPCVDMLSLENMEQRFAALRVYGPERMLKELTAKCISKTKRGNELYELPEILTDGATDPLKLLKYQDPSTDRVYVSFVPEDFADADDAMAWKFSLTAEEYRTLQKES